MRAQKRTGGNGWESIDRPSTQCVLRQRLFAHWVMMWALTHPSRLPNRRSPLPPLWPSQCNSCQLALSRTHPGLWGNAGTLGVRLNLAARVVMLNHLLQAQQASKCKKTNKNKYCRLLSQQCLTITTETKKTNNKTYNVHHEIQTLATTSWRKNEGSKSSRLHIANL